MCFFFLSNYDGRRTKVSLIQSSISSGIAERGKYVSRREPISAPAKTGSRAWKVSEGLAIVLLEGVSTDDLERSASNCDFFNYVLAAHHLVAVRIIGCCKSVLSTRQELKVFLPSYQFTSVIVNWYLLPQLHQGSELIPKYKMFHGDSKSILPPLCHFFFTLTQRLVNRYQSKKRPHRSRK